MEIRKLVEAFASAIRDKDVEGFMGLFLDEDVPWLGVPTERTRDWLTGKAPAAIDENGLYPSSPRAFIEAIAGATSSHEEEVSEVRVWSGGGVGTVEFRYRYLDAGEEIARGHEAWSLVRTAAGWRIAAVVFAIDLKAAEQVPAERSADPPAPAAGP